MSLVEKLLGKHLLCRLRNRWKLIDGTEAG
jgi:hypothetical protein